MLSPHKPEYTGIRAILAMLIIATHICFWTGKVHDTYLGRGLARLEFGVPIFFGLSGFLLMRSWFVHTQSAVHRSQGFSREPSKGWLADNFYSSNDSSSSAIVLFLSQLWQYIHHRFWRIIPAYYAVIFLSMLFSPYFISISPWYLHQGIQHTDPSKFVLYFWFGQIFYPFQQLAGLTHLWSLAEEWDWYIVFPFLAVCVTWLIRRKSNWGYRLALVCTSTAIIIGIIIFFLQVIWSDFPLVNYTFYPLGFLAWFIVGIFVALLPTSFRYGPVIAWLGLGLGCCIAPWHIFGSSAIVDLHPLWAVNKYILYGYVEGLTLYLLKAGKLAVLGTPVLVWLGEISYETFLLHVPILELWMNYRHWILFHGNPWWLYIIVYSITIPLACLLHYFISQLHRFFSYMGKWIMQGHI